MCVGTRRVAMKSAWTITKGISVGSTIVRLRGVKWSRLLPVSQHPIRRSPMVEKIPQPLIYDRKFTDRVFVRGLTVFACHRDAARLMGGALSGEFVD